MSTDGPASLGETLKVMSHPELVEQIRESLAEMADGKSEVLTKDEILANHRADAYR